ncbi:MAG: type IV pilus modification protein PilV [Thiobacillus sp.]
MKMKKQTGFTLLEVMVAMLVLSIGLLGLAGLMASSMRNNQSSYHRTQATWLAYDALDRLRANRVSARAGGYSAAGTLGTPANCSATAPTGTITAQDIGGWKNMIACALPEGDGAIAVANDQVTVTIQWNDSRGTGDADTLATQQFIVESRL